ncbi:hypothetical protein D3C72_2513310 [compost metagenome]
MIRLKNKVGVIRVINLDFPPVELYQNIPNSFIKSENFMILSNKEDALRAVVQYGFDVRITHN